MAPNNQSTLPTSIKNKFLVLLLLLFSFSSNNTIAMKKRALYGHLPSSVMQSTRKKTLKHGKGNISKEIGANAVKDIFRYFMHYKFFSGIFLIVLNCS